MDYFEDIYLKRLNRFGLDYHSRVQNKREKDFELYLMKSVYRVEFEYQGLDQVGVLEDFKQDVSQTFQYLLTKRDLELPIGTFLETKTEEGKIGYWLVYYMKDVAASGYNKYILLKMKHCIELEVEGKTHKLWAYLKGPQESVISDVIKSSGISTIYLEDSNNYILVLPKTPLINKDTYFTLGEDWDKMGYRVMGYDLHSVPGVEFATLNPVYVRDESPPPEKTPDDSEEDFFWLNGGV